VKITSTKSEILNKHQTANNKSAYFVISDFAAKSGKKAILKRKNKLF
jgi:hypothetical protein